VDESHYVKNPKSKRTGAVLKLCKAATRCVLISGTPAVNNAKELYAQSSSFTNDDFYFTRYCEKEKIVFGGRAVTKWGGAVRKRELNILLTPKAKKMYRSNFLPNAGSASPWTGRNWTAQR